MLWAPVDLGAFLTPPRRGPESLIDRIECKLLRSAAPRAVSSDATRPVPSGRSVGARPRRRRLQPAGAARPSAR